MVTRIGGLASGMDIDSLVEKLMQAERAPLDKLTQQKQTYEWQRDAYRSVNTKLKTFDTYIADNLVLKTLNSKTATSSNPAYVSATATGAASGSLSIEGVSQLATAARAVGQQVSAVGSTKMVDLIGSPGTVELKAIQSTGEMPKVATKIDITADMTVDQFISKVNSSNAGVNVVFEGGRFSITAKNTGDNKAGEEIQVVSGEEIFKKLGFYKDAKGEDTTVFQMTEGKNAIFQVNGIATERSSNNFSISGYNVTLKETFNGTKTIAEKYRSAVEELRLADENLLNKQNALKVKQENYYGENATELPSYTLTHNDKYTAAFGNTLTLSQQENYNKLGTAFWKGLSEDEKNFLGQLPAGQSVSEIKATVDNSSSLSEESKTKLKGLADEKLLTASSLGEEEIESYKVQANYAASIYSIKLKEFDQAELDKITQFLKDTPSEGDIADLHKKIDDANFGKDAQDALKSLSEENLKSLLDLDETTLTAYQEKAQADALKGKYSKLGDTVINALQGGTKAVEDLTEAQAEAWNSLLDNEKLAFNDLAQQSITRQAYVAAKNEEVAAQTRFTNADNTEEIARKDASSAGILKPDGVTVDEDKVSAAPTAVPVTLTSTTNVDEMLTKIKEFVNVYNGLIKDLTDQTKQTKYRDYTPLTSEQKEAMSENEVKLWEEKAKSGLLRNDSVIQNGLSNMRSLLYQSNPGISDPRYNTLFSIGITTSRDYNSGGTLEIDETKLRKALEENPDAVEKLLKNSEGKKDDLVNGQTVDTRGYLAKLRESMKTIEVNIETKAGRSSMTDTQYAIGKSLKNVEDRMETWKDKLETIEARYWRQFSAMEAAINKANSQYSLFAQG